MIQQSRIVEETKQDIKRFLEKEYNGISITDIDVVDCDSVIQYANVSTTESSYLVRIVLGQILVDEVTE